MKHKVSIFAILMMALAIPQSVMAFDFSYTYQGKTLYYEVTQYSHVSSHGRVSVMVNSSYSNFTGELIIPSTIPYTETGTGITLYYDVTQINDGAFRGCTGLTSVTLGNNGNNNITINANAFYGCTGLTSVNFGAQGVIIINSNAFGGCSGLTSITLPSSVYLISPSAFSGCNLISICVASGNVTYDSRDSCNAIIKTSTNELVLGCQNTIIPNTVTSIGQYAFFRCSGLTSLTIPNSVTSIGYDAFRNCSGLTSLTIGNSVTSIGNRAFMGCSGLTAITSNAIVPPTLDNTFVFDNVSINIPVYVPCESVSAYQSASGWSVFTNIQCNNVQTYTLTVTSANSVMGTVSGGGTYSEGATATLTATANSGYHFVRWQDNNTQNPRTITVTGDATYTAYFEANVGIENVNDAGIIVYAKDYQIHIDEAFGEDITIYTIDGRTVASLPKATEHVAIPVNKTGVYIIKIGNHPARKVVVIR